MELLMHKNCSFYPTENSPADLSMIIPRLMDSIDDLKHKNSRETNDVNSMILLNTPGKQMLLTSLHKGVDVYSFQSKDSVTFQVIEGVLRISAGGRCETLNSGQSLALYEKAEYILKALEETMFLITISDDIRNNEPAE
jgi:hypothetical protein